jgi:hypothetical protein
VRQRERRGEEVVAVHVQVVDRAVVPALGDAPDAAEDVAVDESA